MFERNPVFDFASKLRPIKAFDPEILLEADTQSYRRFLTPDAKLLWFYQFCIEQGLTGKVDTQFVSAEDLKDIPSNEFAGGYVHLVKEYWAATVYINGESIATATVSGTFIVNDQQERDTASNQLRKSAVGAALSQAGFGVISGFNMTENDIAMLNIPAQPGAPAPTAIPQMAPSAPTAPAQPTVVQNSFFGNAAPNPMGPVPTTTAPAVPVNQGYPAPPVQMPPAPPVTNAPPAPQSMDPVVAAKQTVWKGSGRFKDKSLGDILSEPGGAKNIAWIANEYVPRTADGHKVKEAAKLVLNSLETGN